MTTLNEVEIRRKDLRIILEKSMFKIVLTLLFSPKPPSFNQLSGLLNMNPRTLKHHLDILSEAGFIEKGLSGERRRGPQTFPRHSIS